MNRTFQFLENSRVCIDLCAAPGGWLQVASEYMPVSSVIVGVDLVPISPIRNVITFQGDITTEECSKTIENTLASWKADVVLHDGAPNVGKNWLHDAYGQNVLVVNALKIACTHLNQGGWFITKIFRSADYNSLIWVLSKLFGKVHATKPQASRQESAEIFVVCQNYKRPSKIDPRFFDPSALFADISDFDEALKKQKADLLKPANKIKKTKARGYEDGDILKTVSDVEFVATNNHMDFLAQCHEIKLANTDILEHESTSDEIRECCKDLKILGRKDLLRLLKWRRILRKDLTAKLLKTLKEADHTETASEYGDDDNLDHLTIKSDIDDLETMPELQLDDIERQDDEMRRKEEKHLRRKEEKRLRAFQERVNYGMINPGDVLLEEENDLFNLNRIAGKKHLDCIDDVEPNDLVEEPQDVDEIEAANKAKKSVTFSREADVRYFEHDKDYKSDDEVFEPDEEGPRKEEEDRIIVPDKQIKGANANSALKRLNTKSNGGGGLLVDLMDVNQSKISAASKFFDSDVFEDVDLEKELETDMVVQIARTRDVTEVSNKRKLTDEELKKFDDGLSSEEEDSDDDSSKSEEENEQQNKKKQIKLDPEGLALASMMVSSDKMRQDIEDEGWNRFAHADTHLAPKWFQEEEAKYCRRNIPVRSELVQEYKQKLREIDAKPIKKVLQAKARKKRRAMRKMERVKKKVDAITTNEDTTQKEKISQIKAVYKNATRTKKKEVKLVVGRKGLPAKKPTKGKYKMVDSRMKKDLRAKQRRAGSKSGGPRSKSKRKRSNNDLGGGGKKQSRPNKGSSGPKQRKNRSTSSSRARRRSTR